MCGIFATTNDPDASQTILQGLKNLEYRGYDSWGISVVHSGTMKTQKDVGKISLTTTNLPKAAVGIGHTRWATHGGVTQENAHPHLDCTNKLAVIHNGIVDNWQDLKKKTKSHTYRSQTDSEIIAHLLEDELSKTHDLSAACLHTFKKIQGFNAFIACHTDYPYLVAVKSGSPIIIGYNPGNHLISSDISSLLAYTNKIIHLEDGQIATVSPTEIVIHDDAGKIVKPKIVTIDWKPQAASKGDYPYFMLKEIAEQPGVIQSFVKNKTDEVKAFAHAIEHAKDVYAVACGSASYAALAGQYLFSKIAKIQLNVVVASESSYFMPFLSSKSLCIGFSQSGETIDTIQSIKSAIKTHAQTYSLVNAPGSTLHRITDHSLLLDAGPEKAVASTKAFTSKLAVLLSAAYAIAKKSSVSATLLKKAALSSKKVLAPAYLKHIKTLAQKMKDVPSIFVLGRGASYPIALETALKIKELSYIHAEGFASGELKHGVIALVEKGTPVIVLAPNDETYDDILSAAAEVKARNGYIIGFSYKPNPVFDYYFPIDDAGDASLIPHAICGQLLAYYLALSRGLDPDMPRNLAKSVTVK
jgi:glucosamine--fructose-6-phosphate aminotransferase (isomerizing)